MSNRTPLMDAPTHLRTSVDDGGILNKKSYDPVCCENVMTLYQFLKKKHYDNTDIGIDIIYILL